MPDTTVSLSSADARNAYLQRIKDNTGVAKPTADAPGARSVTSTRFDGKPLSGVEHTAVERFVDFLRSDAGKAKTAVYRPHSDNYREDGGAKQTTGSSKDAYARHLARIKANDGRSQP